MTTGVVKCVIKGCAYMGKERLRFPNPRKEKNMVQIWKSIIKGGLLEMDDEDIYERKRICPIHFEAKFANYGGLKKLLRTAIPTMFLSEKPNENGTVVHVETHIESDYVRLSKRFKYDELEVAEQPNTTVSFLGETSRVPANGENVPTVNIRSRSKTTGVRKLLSKVGLSRKKDLSPKARFFYEEVKVLQERVRRINNNHRSFKARVTQVQKLMQEKNLETFCSNMTPAAKLFTSMQKQTLKRRKGRRYTVEEKIL